MMIARMLLATVAGLALFTGCSEKGGEKTVPGEQMRSVSVAEPETTDVFSRLYSEDEESAAPTEIADETFSLNAPASPEPRFAENGPFVVQVAAEDSRGRADRIARRLVDKGYPAYVVAVENPTPALSGTYYRVRIGRFATIEDGRAFGEHFLRPLNHDYWVARKADEARRADVREPEPSETPKVPSSTPPVKFPDTTDGW